MSVTMGEIKNGIEFYTYSMIVDGREMPIDDCQCARCGSSCTFVYCDYCGGEGTVERDSWDDCGGTYEVTCDWCKGTRGSWHCLSDAEWCEANPRPGRDQIQTTAFAKDRDYD